MLEWFAENDASAIYYHVDVNAPFTWKHIFIDADANASTGYSMAGIGAEYLIENGTLYRQSAPGWNWARVTTAHLVVNGADHDWWILRSDVGATGASPTQRVVFQGNGNAPTFVAPVYTHRFSP